MIKLDVKIDMCNPYKKPHFVKGLVPIKIKEQLDNYFASNMTNDKKKKDKGQQLKSKGKYLMIYVDYQC